VNLPVEHWSATKLECLKTENFTYTYNRDLNRAKTSIQLPLELGFPRHKSSHLVGISDYTSPWNRELGLALAEGLESHVLFALDQFCLIGCAPPDGQGAGRSFFQK
jgi:hypothetical protein